jgi:murein DD-endopeptidase MepM/ murein hydrolase activator NlpD
LANHRSSRTPAGGGTTSARDRWVDPEAAEITDIIPFNEFGDLGDLEFRDNIAFDREAQVVHAPELDDLDDTDNLTPLRLVVPREFLEDPRDSLGHSLSSHAYRDSGAADTDVISLADRRGLHRKSDTAGAVKGRLMIAAMAAGAAAAAAHSVINTSDTASADTVLAAGESALAGGIIEGSADGMQVVSVTPAANAAVHSEELVKGAAFAQERAEREARLQRPLFVMPTKGIYTSGFGYRWGALHGGIDIANSIGTPIYAAADGVVIDAGPAAGFGMWVKLRHADGTVTLYGHVNTTTVSTGERVMAGDQIATMGNRGQSTGPHLHFEVLLNGTDRIDPAPWLAKRGLSVGSYSP